MKRPSRITHTGMQWRVHGTRSSIYCISISAILTISCSNAPCQFCQQALPYPCIPPRQPEANTIASTRTDLVSEFDRIAANLDVVHEGAVVAACQNQQQPLAVRVRYARKLCDERIRSLPPQIVDVYCTISSVQQLCMLATDLHPRAHNQDGKCDRRTEPLRPRVTLSATRCTARSLKTISHDFDRPETQEQELWRKGTYPPMQRGSASNTFAHIPSMAVLPGGGSDITFVSRVRTTNTEEMSTAIELYQASRCT